MIIALILTDIAHPQNLTLIPPLIIHFILELRVPLIPREGSRLLVVIRVVVGSTSDVLVAKGHQMRVMLAIRHLACGEVSSEGDEADVFGHPRRDDLASSEERVDERAETSLLGSSLCHGGLQWFVERLPVLGDVDGHCRGAGIGEHPLFFSTSRRVMMMALGRH